MRSVLNVHVFLLSLHCQCGRGVTGASCRCGVSGRFLILCSDCSCTPSSPRHMHNEFNEPSGNGVLYLELLIIFLALLTAIVGRVALRVLVHIYRCSIFL